MFDMFKSSVALFLQGRLFQDVRCVLCQLIIGVVITITVFIALHFFSNPLWLSIVIASFIGGLIQPFLFKNLKYA